MNVSTFIEYIKEYNEYEILSDSGWECYETDIDAALISHKNKKIILVQSINYDDINEQYDDSYEILYDINEEIKLW